MNDRELVEVIKAVTLEDDGNEINILREISNYMKDQRRHCREDIKIIEKQVEQLRIIASNDTQQSADMLNNPITYKNKTILELEERQKELTEKSLAAKVRNREGTDTLDQLVQQKDYVNKMLKAAEQDVVENAKHKQFFQLYTNISGIEWNYKCPDNQVKGVVLYENDCSPFSFSRTEMLDSVITEKLWELL